MRILRIITIAILASIIPITAFAATRGEKTLGVKGGFATHNTSASAGIYFEYNFSRHFAIAPNIDYIFNHNDAEAFLINVDTHFPFALGTSGRSEIYPIAGINYATWNSKHPEARQDNDVSTRVSRFGFDAGLGLSVKATPTLKISAEAKFNGVKRLSTGIFTVGIGYCF